jgi:hypothetical protein
MRSLLVPAFGAELVNLPSAMSAPAEAFHFGVHGMKPAPFELNQPLGKRTARPGSERGSEAVSAPSFKSGLNFGPLQKQSCNEHGEEGHFKHL